MCSRSAVLQPGSRSVQIDGILPVIPRSSRAFKGSAQVRSGTLTNREGCGILHRSESVLGGPATPEPARQANMQAKE